MTNISLSDYYPLLQLSDKCIFVRLLSPLITNWQMQSLSDYYPLLQLTDVSLSDYYPLLQLTDVSLSDYYPLLQLTDVSLSDYYPLLQLTNVSLSDYYPLLQLTDRCIFVRLLSPLTTNWQTYLVQILSEPCTSLHTEHTLRPQTMFKIPCLCTQNTH